MISPEENEIYSYSKKIGKRTKKMYPNQYTDEEIKRGEIAFINGARWMKEQIEKLNKTK